MDSSGRIPTYRLRGSSTENIMNPYICIIKRFELLKQLYPLTVILIKQGESYFSLFDDAVKVSEVTGNSLEKIPYKDSLIHVCDFPFQFIDKFLPLLVKSGRQVGICEMPYIDPITFAQQLENFKSAFQATIESYIEFLDENAPEWESDAWVIGGVLQTYYRAGGAYGKALQKHDQIGFNVGFQEYKRKFNTRM
jgi:hypothetical protein